MVKYAVEFWWIMLLTIFPSKRSSKISFQTSPEVRHQLCRKLRQIHSGNRWCLQRSDVLPALLQKLVGGFFDSSQGNLENLVGNLEGIFRGFFLTHRTKAQKFRGKFWSIFRKKIRGSKKIFRAKFTLQTCHLKAM